MKKVIERIYDKTHIIISNTEAITMHNSKLSTTNHIIELSVNRDQKPKTKSIANKTIITANPALTPKQ